MEKPLLHTAPENAENPLLSTGTLESVRGANTRHNLKSNFWYDISNYTRWLSTATFMGGLYIVGSHIAEAAATAGLTMTTMGAGPMIAAIGAAMGSGAFLGCIAFGLALATATVITSKYSRKMFVEKTFDVQDFQMQRQAAMVGKAVEKAIDDHETPFKPAKNWVEQVGAPRAALDHAVDVGDVAIRASR